VTCSIFCSRHGDETFGAHGDAWYGAIVQGSGAKDWRIGAALLDGSAGPVCKLTTQAGDILLIPKLLPHVVSTPATPGHSVHLAFAIDRDSPGDQGPGRRPGSGWLPGQFLMS
jgi:ribosomal protein L16 Arg81 hydroxylase